ncbi:MAG: alpha/beta hydrolase [Micromonosporaceae bacterium]|nr:alpha/beta hydrolase [Micromonosporaceae bacterium]
MTRRMRLPAALAAATLMTTALVATTQQAAFAEPSPPYSTCSQHSFTVTISPTDPTPYTMAGQLCLQPDELRGGKTVLLMISGLTYDRSYFNNSYQPYTYSWVYSATTRGYSTFNIDRLGVGQSGRPPANSLTMQTHAYTIEQVVRKLRAGTIGGRAFTNVVGIGHSLGAGVLQYLAGTVTDPVGVPDYLVFSGWLHQGNPTALATLASSLHEASIDPVLSAAGYPSGYMTTIPGTRGANFYHADGADSAVIALDESTKQTGTLVERQTLAAVRASTVTLNITVPVALSVGRYDTLQCDEAAGLTCASDAAVRTRETPYYGAQACLAAFSVPDTGHSVTQHGKGLDSYNFVHSWLDDNMINFASSKDANGCIPS